MFIKSVINCIFTFCVSFLLSLAININSVLASPVQAKTSDSFINSIGVNTHLTYGGTPYQRFDDLVIPKLQEANIRHIRDGGYNNSDFFNKINKLGSIGINSDIIFSGNSMSEVLSIVNSLSKGIDAVEGPNESDLEFFKFSYNGVKFPEGTRNYQKDLYNTIKGNSSLGVSKLPVIGPSMGWGENAGKLGYIGDYITYCNMHSYPNIGQPPTIDLDSYFIPHANKMCGTLPKWVTETGYHNDLSNTTGVTLNTGGKFIPRLLFENFNRNISRTYLYELFNEGTDGGDQSNYGLLNYDGSAKPSYTAIKNITSLFKDSNSNFAPSSLDFSLSSPDVHYSVLQNSKGEFFLVLWQEVRSFNNNLKQDVNFSPIDVKVSLTTSITKAEVYIPNNSSSPVSTQYNNGQALSSINVSVPDYPLIIKLLPSGSDTSVPSTPTPPPSENVVTKGQVIAYQHNNFRGNYQKFSVGTYEANKGQLNIVGNDSISSLYIPKDVTATVCEHESMSGACRTFTSGSYYYIGNTLNDRISYIKVY